MVAVGAKRANHAALFARVSDLKDIIVLRPLQNIDGFLPLLAFEVCFGKEMTAFLGAQKPVLSFEEVDGSIRLAFREIAICQVVATLVLEVRYFQL